ncbi:DUF4383 domain-containing protein [Cellulomonas sp. JZ18]|uniref:DUF4383 domain-containing protein n=1 Tax=Cellulomonas sp. JZ18 TaxID=2654191 RepID=UPI0012D41A5C|nr:DUF4383 domain-containing protein [Cellulomonas sp. JZ18]QGQ18647.1 DUF4383 domain-containing protein [Cellulomonas sp. JZ18]
MSKSPNRLVAAIFGAVYTLVGLAGFLVTGGVPFASQEGELLLGFEVNPLHNIVHLVIGIALLLASRTVGGARSANLTVGAVYLLVGILGLFIIDTEANILALNGADNVLHFATAIILLGVALGADRDRARTTRTA